jgi:tetratricopeptide (TPR) repeat protein
MQALHTLTQIAQPTEAEVRYVLEFIHKLKREGDFVNAEKLLVEGITFLTHFPEINYNFCFRAYYARMLFEQKRYAEAASVYPLVLIELEARYGALRSNYKLLAAGSCNENSGFLSILSTRNNFAIVLHDTGQLDESELLFKEILAIKQHILKPTHIGAINLSTLKSIDRLGMILYNREKYEEAIDYLKSSFSWKSKMYGNCYKETMQTNNYLCYILRKLGKFDDHDYWIEQGMPNEVIPMFPLMD